MFFHSYGSLLHVVVLGVCTYFWLILVLRIAGKRSLAKLNAFDFAVTVAFGSALVTVIFSRNASLADGAVGIGLLAGLQWLVSKLSLRWRWFKFLIRSEPTLLVEDGKLLPRALDHERVTPGEIDSAVRSHGIGSLEEVAAVVLETDGSFSVIRRTEGPVPVLHSVKRIS